MARATRLSLKCSRKASLHCIVWRSGTQGSSASQNKTKKMLYGDPDKSIKRAPHLSSSLQVQRSFLKKTKKVLWLIQSCPGLSTNSVYIFSFDAKEIRQGPLIRSFCPCLSVHLLAKICGFLSSGDEIHHAEAGLGLYWPSSCLLFPQKQSTICYIQNLSSI